MSAGDDRCRALEQLKADRAEHDRRSGQAIPDSRRIERWASEIGRRNDRRDADNHGRSPRRRGR